MLTRSSLAQTTSRHGLAGDRTARIRYAENPPKKYEDIVNVDFYAEDATRSMAALREIVLYWIKRRDTIFRVDNPHTKPLPFWEWLIADRAFPVSRRDFSGGSLYPAENDVPARQG